ALSSIAAVSKMEIITNVGSSEATKICADGGVISDMSSVGAPRGTMIKVSELFFNTPARRKYMKSDSSELEHIIDIVTRYALINHKIYFTLSSNGRIVLSSPGVEDILSNIRNIYGKETEKNVVPLEYSEGGIDVSGHVSRPSFTRGGKDQQSVFVNGRYVKNKVISDAVYRAYHTFLMKHRHPFFVISVKIDSKAIDVNIHPSKREIKIRNDIESKLYDAVFAAVDSALKKNVVIPEAVISYKDFGMSEPAAAKNIYSVPLGTQSTLPAARASLSVLDSRDNSSGEMSFENVQTKAVSSLPEMNVVGQVNKTYVIAQTVSGMVIIDQHAAHERVLYEKFMKKFAEDKVETQNLINVQIIELSSRESLALSSNLDKFKEYGFGIESFGKDTFVVRSVPVVFGDVKSKDVIKDIISDFISLGSSGRISDMREKVIVTMSCRGAIKGGDELPVAAMNKLIRELGKTDNPFTCPHGRPTIINMSVSELERKFKRVV
ncbi:MAG: DNA mismatch repair endonuclease MutL, partial [archaeon]|nr:DNA mismatch repair endonuclease MutL [archaeon]